MYPNQTAREWWIRVIISLILLGIIGVVSLISNYSSVPSIGVKQGHVSYSAVSTNKSKEVPRWSVVFGNGEAYPPIDYFIYGKEKGDDFDFSISWRDNNREMGKETGAEFSCGYMNHVGLRETDTHGSDTGNDTVLGNMYTSNLCHGRYITFIRLNVDFQWPIELVYGASLPEYDINLERTWLYERSALMPAETKFVLHCHFREGRPVAYTFMRQK
jgi:hypothetical protein